jgi:hypothetical protein
MLFAVADFTTGSILLILMFVVGSRQIMKSINSNKVVGQAAKNGALNVLKRIMK